MHTQANLLQVYKELAECYARRGQAQMRDRFLVLAADAALSAGLADEAEQLRLRLLQANPNHMLKPFASFGQARAASDVDTYVRNLSLNYPLDVAEGLLRALRSSDDPGAGSQQQQQTRPVPARPFEEEGTVCLDPDADPAAATEWGDDPLAQTAALPPGVHLPTGRPKNDDDDLTETAHLPGPAASRSRVPTKTDSARTESPPRPTTPRPAAAPRSAAPSSVPPARPSPAKSASSSRPVAPKAPPRPASGSSPFGPFGGEAPPSAAPRRPTPPPEATPEGGGWLATVLLGLVGLLGVGLIAYTVARPFLPKGWLP